MYFITKTFSFSLLFLGGNKAQNKSFGVSNGKQSMPSTGMKEQQQKIYSMEAMAKKLQNEVDIDSK